MAALSAPVQKPGLFEIGNQLSHFARHFSIKMVSQRLARVNQVKGVTILARFALGLPAGSQERSAGRLRVRRKGVWAGDGLVGASNQPDRMGRSRRLFSFFAFFSPGAPNTRRSRR
jgi:hypothetical protein